MATDNLGVVLAQEPWTCKKFISIVLVAIQIRTKEEEGSGDNIVVAYGNFPGDSNIIPIPKSELLIDYCKKERTPLVIGCDTNAQKQHGKVPTTKLEEPSDAFLTYAAAVELYSGLLYWVYGKLCIPNPMLCLNNTIEL
ncbi:unnamed protein product [Ceratitis capitata]|uniref:(Mediterranean fruit fly) hypothetical protein n=1 Tax=Ceratitis capitata TaxID=7213 RepID=A0A811URR4_CERCA|nr:unnamed protein product [Ceratitis capitata]